MSQLLLLRGVFPDEFINADIVSNDAAPRAPSTIYTQLPCRFTGVANHPTHTNLKCWNCDLYFDTYPKFQPGALEHGPNGIECDIKGNFHSWDCVVSWTKSTCNKTECGDIIAAISLIAALFGTTRVSTAPPKTLRKEYCGDDGLTREQYLNYKHGQVLTGYYL